MKTKIEIINETVEYYKTNPRGQIETDGYKRCCYSGYDGSMCAVGRCLENAEDFIDCSYSVLDLNENYGLDNVLKKEYTGHHTKFWYDLQAFHDIDCNWNNGQLSPAGEQCYNKLINDYKNE